MSTIPVYMRIPVQAKALVERIKADTGMAEAWICGQLVARGLGLPTPALDSILLQWKEENPQWLTL